MLNDKKLRQIANREFTLELPQATLVQQVWKNLRNKTAHADELKLTSAETQLLFNQVCACLELFYRLVMTSIGYKGQICQYSKAGWPEGTLS